MKLKTLLTLFALVFVGLTPNGCQSSSRPIPNPPLSEQPNSPSSNDTPSNSPYLVAEIKNLSIYPVPNNGKDLAVSLVMLVRNSGASTAARNWRLSVNIAGRQELGGLEPVHVKGLVWLPGNKAQIDIGKEDLALKSKETSIDEAARLEGILTFVIPDLTTRRLSNNGSSFVVYFEDSSGSSYQTNKYLIGARR